MQVLVDTGCTTNLLAKRIFDQLPPRIQATREEYAAHGIMANGARLAVSGLIQIDFRVRQNHGEETFVVGDIDEDVILGMPFLAKHGCQLNFQQNALTLQDQEQICTNRQGRALFSRLQSCQRVDIPPGQEVNLLARTTIQPFAPIGVAEGRKEDLLLASTLNRPDQTGRVLLRCLNCSDQTLNIAAGSVVGELVAVREEDVQDDTKGQLTCRLSSTLTPRFPHTYSSYMPNPAAYFRSQHSVRLSPTCSRSTNQCLAGGKTTWA